MTRSRCTTTVSPTLGSRSRLRIPSAAHPLGNKVCVSVPVLMNRTLPLLDNNWWVPATKVFEGVFTKNPSFLRNHYLHLERVTLCALLVGSIEVTPDLLSRVSLGLPRTKKNYAELSLAGDSCKKQPKFIYETDLKKSIKESKL